jgi:glycosyltransferase involved in cell wall biosynthesis
MSTDLDKRRVIGRRHLIAQLRRLLGGPELRNPGHRQPHVLLVVENVSLARDHRLRKQAAALLEDGYRVSVICRSDQGNDVLAGVRVYQYRAPADGNTKFGFLREYGYSLGMAGWMVAKTFVCDRFDAIQISGNPDIYFTIAAPLRLAGVRVVLDQRDLTPELYELRYGRRDAAYRLLCRLERVSYRAADHVITVNRSLESIAQVRGGLRARAVSVVGNGPVLARARRDIAPRPELKHARRYLCCWLGVMGPQDQVELALRAVAEVIHTRGRTDCHFAFVGDGESRTAAQQQADRLGIAEFVSFPGWLAEDDAFTYLASADVGLEPNLEEIVSPVKGMEYMAFGLPFVAFDLAETRALARDAAVYAEPGDAHRFAELIDELLDDAGRRARMGRAGRVRIETELAWDHQQPKYLDVYRALLAPARLSDAAPQRAPHVARVAV